MGSSKMVEFDLKVNEKQGTIYLPKWMREAWGYDLKIRPDLISGIMYPAGVPLEDLVKSLKGAIQEIEHEVDMMKRGELQFVSPIGEKAR